MQRMHPASIQCTCGMFGQTTSTSNMAFTSPEKVENNQKLVGMAEVLLKGQEIRALVLDATTMNSCRALMESRCSIASLTVPQMNETDLNAMREIKKPDSCLCKARVYKGSMWSLLQKKKVLARHRVNFAYFDYMGTAAGNKATGVQPLRDIQVFLEKYAADVVVVGFTLCCRGRKVFKKYGTAQQQNWEKYLKPTIAKAGFVVGLCEPRTYKQSLEECKQCMNFYACVLTRRM